MTDQQPTQKTQPRGKDRKTGEPFEPIDIPVPPRKEVDDLMRRVAITPPPKDE